MSRFKVGDEVIVVIDDEGYCKKGDVFVINEIDGIVFLSKFHKHYCVENEIELLSVFTSPLYQALS